MIDATRRGFVAASLAGGAALLTGCAHRRRAVCPGGSDLGWEPSAAERALLSARGGALPIVTRGGPGAAVLRAKARPVPAGLLLSTLADSMERTMNAAGGVGLAGPQVGLGLRVATLMLGYRTDRHEVVFVRNPEIVERSDEAEEGYEGCLSVPGVGGLVRRSAWIRVRHEAEDGQALLSEADGPDAVLWQHELDHLDGVLYLDRLHGELLPMDEVRRLREERERKEPVGWRPPLPLEGRLLG